MSPCPFCDPDPSRIFHQDDLIIGLWDVFPVSPGHALLVPRRHVPTWFDASPEEQQRLTAAIAIAQRSIQELYKPDGYNVGINVGAAADQTVLHLHVHVIPRYNNDVPDPRGGVRWVIPAKANYLAGPKHDKGAGLVRGGSDPLLPHLLQGIDAATQVDIAVSFIMPSGLKRIEPHLRDLLERGGQLRLLTSDYLDVTDPDALRSLLDIGIGPSVRGKAELRVFESQHSKISFHPKAYVLGAKDRGMAYIGSSNISEAALVQGIEWNFRVVDPENVHSVVNAFEDLFLHPATKPLTELWIDQYEYRRRPALKNGRPVEAVGSAEDPVPPPKPNDVQKQALHALRETRAEGNKAALVVMATGLGKTWLSAFDTDGFERVLFVAHREEILDQAMKTFRRVRPKDHLGYYTGDEKAPSATVLFASVQTLGRVSHLLKFAPEHFDYIVVDEFHHASARTYRNLIDHFRPKFLLGLTATPERTDGGDLLALCGENLAFRCDVVEGIRLKYLAPFHYFGVPDLVDYRNIPWRGNHFDDEELTLHVATNARAENALEQWKKRAGKRTLAFCVSTRHANFMADYFNRNGVKALAVHSGEDSAPRSGALERLADVDIQVVFAVDMFNEGVDVPNIDTVLMLRPTGSRILWLQQIGRGLRKAEGKDALTIIDYIGNHRSFLIKPQTLFGLPPGDLAIEQALNLLMKRQLELPAGCEVTYELEAVDIIRSLLRVSKADEAIRSWFQQFQDLHGARPTAVEAFHEGYDPGTCRKHHGSWFGLCKDMDALSEDELAVLQQCSAFLDELERTRMTRSYKMLVLLAMLAENRFPGGMPLAALTQRFGELAGRSAHLLSDVSVPIENTASLEHLVEENPINAWLSARDPQDHPFFEYIDKTLRTTMHVPERLLDTYQTMVRELLDWRLAEYLDTKERRALPSAAELKVVRTNERPVLFVDRNQYRTLPSGWASVQIDDEKYEANFTSTAVDVLRKPGDDRNVLPHVIRQWYGADAGLPGTRFSVVAEPEGEGYKFYPSQRVMQGGPELWKRYSREAIPPLYGLKFSEAT